MSDDKKQAERDKEQGGTFLDESEAGGHTVPESERDKARMKSGRDQDSPAGDTTAHPSTMPPPD